MKKSILFAYPELFLGGSTTSLISLLSTIDYNKYDVDLVLYRKGGEFIKDIPKEVNLLDEVCRYKKDTFKDKIRFLLVYIFKGHILKALIFEIIYGKRIGISTQVLSQTSASTSIKINKEYDVAVGYLEYWANDYVLNHINAKKKIAWIHTDYINAKFIPEIDYKTFSKAARIVCVSEECLKSLNKSFPLLAGRFIYIDNIISVSQLLKKSSEVITDFDINFDGLKVITVSRLTIYTKGFDRIISAVKRLTLEGYDLRWYFIGDGPDQKRIKKLINQNNLEQNIILIGRRMNPYPYLKKCDIFAMPSRYEGKPMAVTEAQIMGLPIIVTNYKSASEQVRHDIDGLIIDNNEDSIYYGVKKILDNPELLRIFKMNLQERYLSNEDEINKFYNLIR